MFFTFLQAKPFASNLMISHEMKDRKKCFDLLASYTSAEMSDDCVSNFYVIKFISLTC